MDRSLLERFYRGNVSEREASQVMEWLNSSEAEKEIEEQTEAYFDGDSHKKIIWNSEGALKAIYSNIRNQITNEKKIETTGVSERLRPGESGKGVNVWKVAAVIMLFLIPSVIFLIFFSVSEEQELGSSETAVVIKHASKGQKLSIYLSDGTKAILNSDSEIRYPLSFGKEDRSVHVKGEVFFEVRKDTSRPFIVQTSTFQTIVLGTSFNVSAKPGRHENAIALKTGKILVKTKGLESAQHNNVYLEPGEMLIFNSSDMTSEITTFSEELVFGWTRNTLSFKNQPLENVFAELESWYGVEFQFNDKYEQKKGNLYSGRFENESLENVLTGLGYVNSFEFKIIDKSVEIKFN